MREALGRAAAVAKGALGISSETCAESGKERRTATSAPPAEILRAVANSRNSFPFSSRLRTNTGMARGSRVHLRRSVSGFRRFNPAPWIRTYARESRIWGAKPHTRMGRLQVKHPQMWDVSLKTTLLRRRLHGPAFAFYTPIEPICPASGKGYNCKLFLLDGQLYAFFVDREKGVTYHLDIPAFIQAS
jgi:hypothetical protein